MMSNPPTFVSGDISVLQETIDLACSKYDALYVSIGGKHNQPAVSFHNPSYLASNQYRTNSSFQMIPAFLRNPDAVSRTMVVVVDEFDTEETRQTNLSIVGKLCAQFPHIDVVLYHKKLHLDDVSALANTFVRFAHARAIPPTQVLFCNFIRFRGCLSVDVAQFETEVPRRFQKTLDADGTYAECLYQWFGYQFYVYHLVYSYKHYDTKRHLSVLRLLTECCSAIPLVSGNVDHLFDVEHAHYPQNKRVLLGLIDTVVDLTSDAICPEHICSPLRRFCSESGGAHYTFSPANRALAAAIDL
jgi:hypothetical protein